VAVVERGDFRHLAEHLDSVVAIPGEHAVRGPGAHHRDSGVGYELPHRGPHLAGKELEGIEVGEVGKGAEEENMAPLGRRGRCEMARVDAVWHHSDAIRAVTQMSREQVAIHLGHDVHLVCLLASSHLEPLLAEGVRSSFTDAIDRVKALPDANRPLA
jgi:hypothetical protein